MISKASFFSQKTALITGGSSGIGLATAEALVKEGAHVVIAARDSEKLQKAKSLLEEVRKSSSQKIEIFQFDAKLENQVQSLFSYCEETLKQLDILINCIGDVYSGTIQELELLKYKEQMESNFIPMVNLCLTGLPYLKKNNRETYLVNISSVLGFLGIYGQSAYTASKYAVTGFCEVLRQELEGSSVNLSVIFPPDTDTPMLRKERMSLHPVSAKLARGLPTLSAGQVAQSILNAICKKKYYVFCDWRVYAVWVLGRWFPNFLYNILRRKIRKVI